MMIPYKYTRATVEGLALIVGKVETSNPINGRHRILPFEKMRVGDALHFYYAEMIEWQWRDAKSHMNRYNKQFDNMFVAIKHPTFLEIVRIK